MSNEDKFSITATAMGGPWHGKKVALQNGNTLVFKLGEFHGHYCKHTWIPVKGYSYTRDKLANYANYVVTKCHESAKKGGWWTDLKTGEPINPNDAGVFGLKIALVHSELSEALEGQRKNLMDDHLKHRKAVEVELADAVIRIFDLAGAMKLDLGGALAEKLEYNSQRADHKPENRAKDNGKSF